MPSPRKCVFCKNLFSPNKNDTDCNDVKACNTCIHTGRGNKFGLDYSNNADMALFYSFLE